MIPTPAYILMTAETLLVNSALKLHFRQVIVNLSPMQKSIYRPIAGLRPPVICFEATAEGRLTSTALQQRVRKSSKR